MPNISLTTFVDFVIRSGTARLTYVRNAKRRYGEEYDPAKDYWRGLRNRIIEMHQKEKERTWLDECMERASAKKKVNYAKGVAGYKKWLGRKEIHWVGYEGGVWEAGDLTVRVNPELALRINEEDHIIKMYFKSADLSKAKVETMLYLINSN